MARHAHQRMMDTKNQILWEQRRYLLGLHASPEISCILNCRDVREMSRIGNSLPHKTKPREKNITKAATNHIFIINHSRDVKSWNRVIACHSRDAIRWNDAENSTWGPKKKTKKIIKKTLKLVYISQERVNWVRQRRGGEGGGGEGDWKRLRGTERDRDTEKETERQREPQTQTDKQRDT